MAKDGATKPDSKVIAIVIIAVFIILGAAMLFAMPEKPPASTAETASAEQPAIETPATEPAQTAETAETPTPAPVSTETPAPGEATADASPAATPPAAAPAAPVARIDVNAALSDKIMGDTAAPLKITEHLSMTCSHCADFYKETFDKIKKDYVDKGKAYIVFSDFPLNAPAMAASIVARCLPEAKYFDFIKMLFEKQEDWAYSQDFSEYLQARAAENGLPEEQYKACLANKEIAEGIANRMKGVQGQWNIQSTPSFVINNTRVVSGAYPYEEFKKILDEELIKAEGIRKGNAAAAAAAAKEQSKKEDPAPSSSDSNPDDSSEDKDPAAATETETEDGESAPSETEGSGEAE